MSLVNVASALVLGFGLATRVEAEVAMVMVEQPGCIYCARWDREIAPIWPLSEEGRRAPLRRVDLHDLPDDIEFASPPRLTPTFVLVDDGVEQARIEGYAGDEFFWAMTDRMLDAAGVPEAQALSN